ncbi:MAG: 23S rRNA (adenine(2503)-C(2))-methyltransferase RlmN, partial [Epsilonproteobacteria bacterium]|nr:23S rRNA (adenine(2503)-C(2))-methyltransferase RlmN [Campylobacterota bacterium]
MLPFIYDFKQDELKEMISPAFRAKQIWNWLYHKYIDDFDQMSNIPKDLKQQLKDTFSLRPLEIVTSQKSNDGSIKYLFRLHDGHTVEAVLLQMKEEEYHEDGTLKHHKRYTVCVSSQVGCKVGCAFCLTAKGGFVRNLTAGEIVAQLLMIKKANDIGANRRVNIVYMGMG